MCCVADALSSCLPCGCEGRSGGICFVVAHGTIKDTVKMPDYNANAIPTLAASGGIQLSCGQSTALAGGRPFGHPFSALYCFPSVRACKLWYASAAYRRLIPLREQAAELAILYAGTDSVTSPVLQGGEAFIVGHGCAKDFGKLQEYSEQAAQTVEAAGGIILGGGSAKALVGKVPVGEMMMVIMFPSREAALAWYNSPEYQILVPLRQKAVELTLVLV